MESFGKKEMSFYPCDTSPWFCYIDHQPMKLYGKELDHSFHQHDVDILDNHRISIFNNNSKDFVDGDVVDGHNEVINL
jgi:hypothetical protein